MLTRRSFLATTGLSIGALGMAPQWLLRVAAQAQEKRKILIVVFQRGAADGLNMVVPFFERRYSALRPSIAVAAPGAPNGGIDLDGRFALHPSLQPLKELWDSHSLAIIHAAGSPDPTRSHFDAQDYMESGTQGRKLEDGWLNRSVPLRRDRVSPMRAVAMGPQVPLTLRGSCGAIAVDHLTRTFQLGPPETAAVVERLYLTSSDVRLREHGKGTFDAARSLAAITKQPYTPANGAQYLGEFGRRLQQIARLIKGDVGLEVAFADIGGWDHHTNETQQLGFLLREFGTSLAAFARDMGERMTDIVLVTMSEFGRTTAENGNGGTDHGHGNVMLVIGGAVRGGAFYGEWPGLEQEQLFEGRDLAVTTDYRDVLGEVVSTHLGQNAADVFPGHGVRASLGLLRS